MIELRVIHNDHHDRYNDANENHSESNIQSDQTSDPDDPIFMHLLDDAFICRKNLILSLKKIIITSFSPPGSFSNWFRIRSFGYHPNQEMIPWIWTWRIITFVIIARIWFISLNHQPDPPSDYPIRDLCFLLFFLTFPQRDNEMKTDRKEHPSEDD